MSVSTAEPLSSLMSPIAIPATGALTGTPASMSASDDPQTEAIELEPLLSVISETIRITYGNSASVGITALIARSAKNPCPTSRRPGPRIGLVSPTENGGKL